jgi:hypothetical protein
VAPRIPALGSRLESSLAVIVVAVIGLSLLAFVAMIVGTAVGVRDFGEGIWPTVIVLPLVGLPIGILVIIALVVAGAIRRGRQTGGRGR